jgi:hypothetical protein
MGKMSSSSDCSGKSGSWGGGKGGKTPYDPQISAATAKMADISERAQLFSESYFNEVLKPSVLQQMGIAERGGAQLEEMTGLNIAQMKQAQQRYEKYGMPAEEAYYKAVQDYSSPEEQQRQALAAKGDIETAFAGQDQQGIRAVGAMGGGPLDVGRMAAMRSQQMPQRALIEANAMTRARNAAQTLGLQLKSDAANFGRGGQSGILAFGAGAQGNIQGQGALGAQATGSAVGAAGVPLQGMAQAQQGFNNIGQIYSSQANNFRQAQAANNPMNAIGELAGVGLKAAIGPAGLSDIRLKHNIVFAGKDATGVNLYFFNYNDRPGRWLGVIAQELQKIASDLVYSVGGYLAVKAPYLPRRIG